MSKVSTILNRQRNDHSLKLNHPIDTIALDSYATDTIKQPIQLLNTSSNSHADHFTSSNNNPFHFDRLSSANCTTNSRVITSNNHHQIHSDSLRSVATSNDIHNNKFFDKAAIFLNEVQILKDRIEKRAKNEERKIDEIYEEVNAIDKEFSKWKSDFLFDDSQKEKQILKIISLKIRNMFSELKVNFEEQQSLKLTPSELNSLENKIEKTQNEIKSEEKHREKEWEEQIDSLGKMTLDIERDIFALKEDCDQKHKKLSNRLWKVETSLKSRLHDEKKTTDCEHDLILGLINTLSQKMVLL